MTAYLDDLMGRYPTLESCREEIASAVKLLVKTFQSKGKLLTAGNGGSAADADHISGELLKGFAKTRPIVGDDRELLGDELADQLQGALPALPLPQFAALATAFANDCNAEYTFAQLVWGLGEPNDVLLAISTSGNSKNVIHAVNVAKKKGVKVIGLTSEGGKLKELADVAICAPAKEVHHIQEFHLPIYHAICIGVEEALF